MPTGSGSMFYNYKRLVSILLSALVDTNVGAVGKPSDSNIFKK